MKTLIILIIVLIILIVDIVRDFPIVDRNRERTVPATWGTYIQELLSVVKLIVSFVFATAILLHFLGIIDITLKFKF